MIVNMQDGPVTRQLIHFHLPDMLPLHILAALLRHRPIPLRPMR
jgi:hypothetical protein